MVCAALAAAQVRLGHEVLITCEAEGSPAGPVDALLAPLRGGERLEIERVPAQGLFAALYGDIRTAAPRFARGADLVHIHGVWNPIGMAASRAARRLRAPYLVSTHGALHPSCMLDRSGKKATALALGWRRMLRDARRVLCLNEEEARETDRIARKQVSLVVPNGVDLIVYDGLVRGAFRATRGDRPYFVFVGRLDRVKGLDALLEAFAAYRTRGGTADLVLVGPDWGEQKAIEGAAARAGLTGAVSFTGPLYDRRKLEALADAIAFVHRPRYEGFGLAVVEAMACGTPAILGDRCLLPVAGEPDGVVLAGDTTDLFADAMQRLERDPALRDRLGDAGRACVERRFEWGAIAESTLRAAGLGEEE